MLTVNFASKCAWRAVYILVRRTERQIAHLGIDPTATRPNIFGGVLSRRFRINIPFMRWDSSQWRIKLKWQQFIHSLDGRFVGLKR